MLNLTPVTEQHVLDNPDKQFIAVWKYGSQLWSDTIAAGSHGGLLSYSITVDGDDQWVDWSLVGDCRVTFYGEAE